MTLLNIIIIMIKQRPGFQAFDNILHRFCLEIAESAQYVNLANFWQSYKQASVIASDTLTIKQ